MEEECSVSSGSEEPDLIIDYVKSQLFRVVYAEGIWGGLSGNGDLHLSFWNSREPIPKRVNYRVADNGELVETSRETRCDLVREVEIGVLMNLATARALRNWLDEMIDDRDQADVGGDSAGGKL